MRPEDQWWAINGQALRDALQTAHDGTPPDIVYLELIANSEMTEFKDGEIVDNTDKEDE